MPHTRLLATTLSVPLTLCVTGEVRRPLLQPYCGQFLVTGHCLLVLRLIASQDRSSVMYDFHRRIERILAAISKAATGYQDNQNCWEPEADQQEQVCVGHDGSRKKTWKQICIHTGMQQDSEK